MTRPATARIAPLDALRGIAALIVVMHHVWLLGAWQPATAWQWRLLRYTPLNLVLEGRQPVILFFVLSGFVLARALIHKPTPYGVFIVRRFTRIYLPFAAAILLSALAYAWLDPALRPYSAWFGNLWRDGWAPATLLRHLAMPGTQRDDLDPVIWSLVHELRISALIPMLLWAARRHFGLLLAGSAAVQVATGIDPASRPFWGDGAAGSLLVTLYFVPFFVLGVGLAVRRTAVPPRLALPALVASLALLSGGAGSNDLAYGAGAALLVALALDAERVAGALDTLPARFLGRISYSVYLIHVPVFLTAVYAFHAGIAVLVPAALIVGWGFHRAVERPTQRLGALLTAPAQPASSAKASARA